MRRILSTALLLGLAFPATAFAQQSNSAPVDPHGTPQSQPSASGTRSVAPHKRHKHKSAAAMRAASNSQAAHSNAPRPEAAPPPPAAPAAHGTPQ